MLDKNWDKMFGISLASALALGCCSNWNGVQVQNRLDLEEDHDEARRPQIVVISEKEGVAVEETHPMAEAEFIANKEILENCGSDCACSREGDICKSDIDCCDPAHVCDTGRCEYEKP